MIYLIIIALVIAQIYVLYQTLQKTKKLSNIIKENKNVFERIEYFIPKDRFDNLSFDEILSNRSEYKNPNDSVSKYTSEEYDNITDSIVLVEHEKIECKAKNKISINLIDIKADNDVAKLIEKAINNYLLRNKGAASDYSLIKDIVERYCTSEEEEIETQTPWPLYFGLMGTMFGIIFGIGNIALNVGFETFVNQPTTYMGQLMGDIAIAMIASLCGIGFTTYLSWAAKNAKTVLEDKKNGFYTWFQTELMPIITKENASEGIRRLEDNLGRFNDSFSENIGDLNKTFENVKATSKDQALLLTTLQKMDLKKMSEANVTILSEFNKTVCQLDKFNEFFSYSQSFLKDVDVRNAAIKESAISLDNNLNEVYGKLNESIRTQVDALKGSLMQSEQEIEKLVASEKKLIDGEGEKITKFNETMETLKPVIEGLNGWKGEMQRQNTELSRLSQAINTIPSIMGSMNGEKGSQKIVVEQKSNMGMLIGAIVAVVLLLAVLGTNLYYMMSLDDNIRELKNNISDAELAQDSISIDSTSIDNTSMVPSFNSNN